MRSRATEERRGFLEGVVSFTMIGDHRLVSCGG